MTAEGEPSRTWVFETDEKGEIQLSYAEDYVISELSEEFFLNQYGIFTIPAGTITIQETKAPEGYLLNPEIKTVHFTIQADGTVEPDIYTWNTTNGPMTLTSSPRKTSQKPPSVPRRTTM